MCPVRKDKGANGTKVRALRKAIIPAAVAIVVILSAYVFYGFNGDSFDLSDRQVLLIVSDSMDGDVTEYRIQSFPQDTFVMIRHLSNDEKMDIQVGDVLSFEQKIGSQTVINHHRVIETHITDNISTSYVITRGDNPDIPPSETETVYLDSVNGEVIGTNHATGVVASFIKNHAFIVLSILFVVLALFIIRWMLKDDGTDVNDERK